MAFKFFNIGKANDEISNLESKVAELTSEVASLKENTPQIEAAAESLKVELTETKSKLAQAESDLSTSKASLASVSAELKVSNDRLANPPALIKEAAAVQAAVIAASVGVPPISASAQSGGEKLMSRSDFGKLSPSDQAAFCRTGGRLTQ